jgi:hypothetical protein
LLVIECQQEKLSGQALNFGSRAVHALKMMYPKRRIALVPTSAYCDLGASLAEVLAEYGRFRSILVVGHSNAVGIQLANDQFCTWGTAGLWLAKFEPEILFFAACEAGRSAAVRSLFEAVPTLREVYASPVRLYAQQSTPLAALIALALRNRRIDPDASAAVRGLNLAITGGQIFRWRRGELGEGHEVTNKLWDLMASICNKAAAGGHF